MGPQICSEPEHLCGWQEHADVDETVVVVSCDLMEDGICVCLSTGDILLYNTTEEEVRGKK